MHAIVSATPTPRKLDIDDADDGDDGGDDDGYGYCDYDDVDGGCGDDDSYDDFEAMLIIEALRMLT